MRDWVWKALCAVVLQKTYSNLYLKDHLDELPEKDRALATRIFYGTLQNYSFCQAVWKRFAKQGSKINSKIGVLLTMSVYQLLFLNKVPAYAVIDEAVRIAAKNVPQTKGFVNAVLRRVTREPFELPADPVQALALKTSLPEWLIRLWVAQYGAKEAFQFANASIQSLPEYVRIKPEWKQRKEVLEDHNLALDESGLYRYLSGSPAADPLYRKGVLSIQDPGSYAIARMMDPKPGETILDLCAAPGTKTMAMAEMMENQGKITACDLHEHRVGLIKNDARRLLLDIVDARVQDSTKLDDFGQYDRVLCDVPCTGLGVLGRKPDMKLNLNDKEIDALVPIQKELLESGASHVKDGGILVYSTCTLNKKENERQVENFLQTHPEFELEEQKTLYPNGEHDGFYMARLKKGSKS